MVANQAMDFISSIGLKEQLHEELVSALWPAFLFKAKWALPQTTIRRSWRYLHRLLNPTPWSRV